MARIFFLLIFSTVALGFDKFDLQVCEMQKGVDNKINCYEELNAPGACKFEDMEKRLECLQVTANKIIENQETNKREQKEAEEREDQRRKKQAIADSMRKKKEREEQDRRDAAIGKGKWKTTTSISAIDDGQNVYLQLDSEDRIFIGSRSYLPTLHIRCAEKALDLYIHVGHFLGSGSTSVTTRYDKYDAWTRPWRISTDHNAIFAPEDVVKNLSRFSTLLVKLTPYSENPVLFEFDLRGLKKAIGPISQKCEM